MLQNRCILKLCWNEILSGTSFVILLLISLTCSLYWCPNLPFFKSQNWNYDNDFMQDLQFYFKKVLRVLINLFAARNKNHIWTLKKIHTAMCMQKNEHSWIFFFFFPVNSRSSNFLYPNALTILSLILFINEYVLGNRYYIIYWYNFNWFGVLCSYILFIYIYLFILHSTWSETWKF